MVVNVVEISYYVYNTFHDTRGYYTVHEIQVPVEGRGAADLI